MFQCSVVEWSSVGLWSHLEVHPALHMMIGPPLAFLAVTFIQRCIKWNSLANLDWLNVHPANQAIGPRQGTSSGLPALVWLHKQTPLYWKGRSVEEERLNVIDYEAMNAMMKLKWLQQFMWNIDIDKCGGIDFLLKCDFPLSCPSSAGSLMLEMIL